MKKILVTGASGFIGSFLVEEAIERGWEVWAGIRKTSNREYLTDSRIRFIDLHFSNPEQLQKQISEHVKNFGKWDYIIHNAGVTKCLYRDDFDKVNYTFTRNFIDALEQTRNVPEKFILMSSLSARPNPETAYGKSKLKAEQFLQTQKEFPYIILRPTGVYGPREKDYFLMIKSIKAGFDMTAGLKPQKLTFIYVKDLVKAVFLSLESPVSGKTYFVADGDVYTDKEYTEIVKKVLGKKFVLRIRVPLFLLKWISAIAEDLSKFTKQPSTLNRDKFKIMKQRDWTCDPCPLTQELGFKAGYNLERGMQECIEWYKKNHWI
ncbi:NAD-dependent dehydratase [Bacteroidia bacterium]|nr:NAD-dependent dehydratase [Bacteroidia bacterium]